MRAATQIRVAHPFAHFAKGWGIAVLAMLIAPATYAQDASCGLTNMKDSTPLQYPPIARAAHVTGNVISIVKFGPAGSVDDVAVISGPELLRKAALTYIKGLEANPQSGTRQCPFVVEFEMVNTPPCENSPTPAAPFQRLNVQHVIVRTNQVWLCDPGPNIHKRKRFLFF